MLQNASKGVGGAGGKDPKQILAERPTRRTRSDAGIPPPPLRVVKAYTIGDSLGQGAFGKVFRGLNLKTGEVVAIKQIDKHLIASEDWPMVLQELNLLQELIHPNIVQFIDYHDTSDYLYFILEFVEGGSLYSVVRKFGAFPDRLLVLFIVQVLRGLRYLHSKGVMHRDIKGANILLTKEGNCKLADFGSATYAAVNRKLEAKGTPFWMAPELIDETAAAGLPSDIWSVGCTIIELLTGEPPYWKLGPTVALYRMANDPHPPLPDELQPQLRDFLMKCFERNPAERPTADELLRHTWITSIWGEEPRTADIAPKPATSTKEVSNHDGLNTKRLTNAIGNLFKKITPREAPPSLAVGRPRSASTGGDDQSPLQSPKGSSQKDIGEDGLEKTRHSDSGPELSHYHSSHPSHLSHPSHPSHPSHSSHPAPAAASAPNISTNGTSHSPVGTLNLSGIKKSRDAQKTPHRLCHSAAPSTDTGERHLNAEEELECNLNLSPRASLRVKSSEHKKRDALSPRFMENLIKKAQPKRTNSDEVKRKQLHRRDSKDHDSGTDEESLVNSTGSTGSNGSSGSNGSGINGSSPPPERHHSEKKRKCANCAKWAALDKERAKEREESKLVVNTLKDSITLLTKEFDCIIGRTKTIEDLEKQLLDIKEAVLTVLEMSAPSQASLDQKSDDEEVPIRAEALKRLMHTLDAHPPTTSASKSTQS